MNVTTNRIEPFRGTEGFALVVSVLVMLAISFIAVTAITITSNDTLLTRYYEREELLGRVADDGIEYARALINGNPGLYPQDGYNALEVESAVQDAQGNTVEGVKRSLYVGPTGVTSGQYGVFGTVVSVVEDNGGGIAVRRGTVYQESFAKFAYFTDFEPSNIKFGGGDQIFGPMHTNSPIRIYSSRATFHGEVTTAQDVEDPQYGTFKQGYEEYVSPIPMPATQDLDKLRSQAQKGGTNFTTSTPSTMGDVNLRIEFVAIDLDGDGENTGADEGFFRVYQSNDTDWISGNVPLVQSCYYDWRGRLRCNTVRQLEGAENCGRYYGSTFVPSSAHPYSGNDPIDALLHSSRVCYLGGDPRIFNGFQASDSHGSWVKWNGAIHPGLSGRADREYLFPLSRRYNPSFKGVIFVDGTVGISGELRGKLTIAATGDIVLLDDMVYATDPGAGTCVDMMGMFSGDDVVVADNALNSPVEPNGSYSYRTYDETSDEFFHGVVLALDIFTVEDYNAGSRSAQPCEGTSNGRGCLYLTGGIIQDTRGAVGLTSGEGYIKRYSYDPCAAQSPPPYFPTTGQFAKGQQFYVDPTGFDVGSFYALLTPSG